MATQDSQSRTNEFICQGYKITFPQVREILGLGTNGPVEKATAQKFGGSEETHDVAVKTVWTAEEKATRKGRGPQAPAGPHDLITGNELARQKLQSNPHGAKVYATYTQDNKQYVIMELAQGQTFDALMRNGAYSNLATRAQEVRSDITQAVRAIAYMHEHGLSHGGITPGNFLRSDDGIVKTVDFDGVQEDVLAVVRKGGVAYKSPEAQEGTQADTRADDVWGLGRVFAWMLRGEEPYSGRNIEGRWGDYEILKTFLAETLPDASDQVVKFLARRVCVPERERVDAAGLLKALEGEYKGCDTAIGMLFKE